MTEFHPGVRSLQDIFTEWCDNEGYPVREEYGGLLRGGCPFHEGGNPYSFVLFHDGGGYCHSDRCSEPNKLSSAVAVALAEVHDVSRDPKRHTKRKPREPDIDPPWDVLDNIWRSTPAGFPDAIVGEQPLFAFYLHHSFHRPSAWITLSQAAAAVGDSSRA